MLLPIDFNAFAWEMFWAEVTVMALALVIPAAMVWLLGKWLLRRRKLN